MQRDPRGIDSLSASQFAGLTLAVSLLAFTCGGIVQAATLARLAHAAAPLEPVPPDPGSGSPYQAPPAANQVPPGANQAPPGANQAPPGANQAPPGANRIPPGANAPSSPAQPVIFDDGADRPESPPAPSPVHVIDVRTAATPELAPDRPVTDLATAPEPRNRPDPRIAVIDLARAPLPASPAASPVAIYDGAAPPRGGSVEVIDGNLARSVALGTIAPRTSWGIASSVDVIDGSAAHVRPRTSS
jgi:hypothetical protein